MGRNNFREDLQMSYESCQLAIDEKTLKNYFKFAESVEKTESDEDKTGIDYYVNLRGGKRIGVDVKTRRRGTAKYWKNGCPELVIELWSQAYSSRFDERNKIGWTIDYKKRCQYIMYKFDAEECDKVFIFPFEQLLITTYKYMQEWAGKYGLHSVWQDSADYHTVCVYVPADVVIEAVKNEFTAKLNQH